MQKKSWIITFLTAGFTIFLIVGVTSALAEESTPISDLLNDPSAYEGIEVEVTGTIVNMDFGLLIEEDSGAQIRVMTRLRWFIVSPYGAELHVAVGDEITVVGTVHTGFNCQDENSVFLVPLDINGVTLPEDTGTHPWVGGRGHFRMNRQWGQGRRGFANQPCKCECECTTTESN